MISFSVDLPVTFPSGHTQDLSFYVTKLDSPSTAVLGLNWLTAFNPLVDWLAHTITFLTVVPLLTASLIVSGSALDDMAASLGAFDELSDFLPSSSTSVPSISLIGAAAFTRAV